jgi:IMP cyclohydrolase
MTLRHHLRDNPYPGRLNLIARTANGDLVALFLISGRTAASRNRTITAGSSSSLLTVSPTDSNAARDELRHYVASVQTGHWFVLGNGDHVSRLAQGLDADGLNSRAVSELRNEPDAPIFTPRIALAIDRGTGGAWFFSAQYSSPSDGGGRLALWHIWEVAVGRAYSLSTYTSDGNQIATGPPLATLATDASTPPQLLEEVWEAADQRFRVAAAAINLAGNPPEVLLCP